MSQVPPSHPSSAAQPRGLSERLERARRGLPKRAPAPLIRLDGRWWYQFLAFPGEEPPSIECNEDAGEEFIDS